jgi:hypothetical protein
VVVAELLDAGGLGEKIVPFLRHAKSRRGWGRDQLLFFWEYPLVNIAMENAPFIDGLPINSMVIFHGYCC